MALNYSRNGDFATIVIKDSSDNTIFKKRINLANKQEYFETMLSIAEKYGFKPEIDFGKDINSKNIEKEKNKEKIDWLS